MGAKSARGWRRADRLPRRATDRVEDLVAWLLITAGLLAAVLIGTVTSAVHRTAMERAAVETAARHQVPAAPSDIARSATTSGRQMSHTAGRLGPIGVRMPAPVVPGHPRGTAPATRRQALVWVDANGSPARPPTTPAGAAQAAVVVAVGLSVAALLALIGTWLAVRALTARLNDARWEREWARVGPRWSRRVH